MALIRKARLSVAYLCFTSAFAHGLKQPKIQQFSDIYQVVIGPQYILSAIKATNEQCMSHALLQKKFIYKLFYPYIVTQGAQAILIKLYNNGPVTHLGH